MRCCFLAMKPSRQTLSSSMDAHTSWRTCGDHENMPMLDMALISDWFRVQTAPSRRPLAQKSLLAPYRTCTSAGSMMLSVSRESMETKDAWVRTSGFGNNELA